MAASSSLLKNLRTVKELADDLRFPTTRACRAWLRREKVPHLKRGRVILIDPRDVETRLRKVAS